MARHADARQMGVSREEEMFKPIRIVRCHGRYDRWPFGERKTPLSEPNASVGEREAG